MSLNTKQLCITEFVLKSRKHTEKRGGRKQEQEARKLETSHVSDAGEKEKIS